MADSPNQRESSIFVPCVIGALVLLLALLIRLKQLDSIAYWFDESFSIRMSEFSIGEMVSRCSRDTHPPLFFLSLKAWTNFFGTAEWPTRFYTVLWSLGAVACAFGFTYEAVDRSLDRGNSRWQALFAATLSGLCLSLSPIQISWAQQVRMYAPVVLLSILSTWLLWRAIANRERWSLWLPFILVEIVGLYTHVTLFFVCAAHFLGLLAISIQLRKDGPEAKAILLRSAYAAAAIGLFALPWILVVLGQHARVQEDFWIKPLDLKLLGESFVRCFGYQHGAVEDPMVGLWIAQAMCVLLMFVALGRQPFHLLVALAAGLPFLILIVVSWLDVNIVNGRYFIAGHALCCVAVGAAVIRLPAWWLRFTVGAGMLAALIWLADDYHTWRSERPDSHAIPELLATWREHRASNELLLFCSPMFYTTARIYSVDDAQIYVFGSSDDYAFFVGTAVTGSDEYQSAADIDVGDWQTVWTCDFGTTERFLQPVKLNQPWTFVTEKSFVDYSGTFYLRQYDRGEKKKSTP